MDNLSLAASDIDRIDDLPRAFTYRRQRAREASDAFSAPEPAADLFDVPVGRLAVFFLKCAVAAIPALALLTGAAWVAAAGLGLVSAEVPSIPLPIYAPDASQ